MSSPSKLQVLQSLLHPLPKSQSKTVLLAIQAIASMAQATSLAIAAFFSQATGSQMDSALTRFYRLLHNPRLDDLQITKQFLSVLAQGRSSLWIALDWTEWHPPLRMLLASVIVGTLPGDRRLRRLSEERDGAPICPLRMADHLFRRHVLLEERAL